MTPPDICILLGATASGKSGLALTLAEKYDAEIIGADSRQIYRGMEIGTAAPTTHDRSIVPHHLIGFLDPHERYSAAQFTIDAHHALAGIFARGKRAIIVGGTGFYVRALTGDMQLGTPAAVTVRKRMRREEQLHDAAFLHGWLCLLDPARANILHPHDTYRVGQALERALARRAPVIDAAVPVDDPAATVDKAAVPLDDSAAPVDKPAASVADATASLDNPAASSAVPPAVIAPRPLQTGFRKFQLVHDPAVLRERIEQRIDQMLATGFIEEAESIGLAAVAASAVGYDCVFAYLRGQATRAELRNLLIRATTRYAKRQRTWLRREPATTELNAALPLATLCESIAEQLHWART